MWPVSHHGKVPLTQVSPTVQAFPVGARVVVVCVDAAVIELHESFVQGLSSLQGGSWIVDENAARGQGVHVSVVQALWSSQSTVVPMHCPARQVSCVVQASRSSQALPSVGVPPQTPPLHVPPEAHGLSPRRKRVIDVEAA